jgi:RHS repeat-associated protein
LAHNDLLYTTDKLTKAPDGRVSWSVVREAFGKNAVAADSQMTYLLRFPGQWEDLVGGFAQNWWREFSSLSGSYRSNDIVAIHIGGINGFVYSFSSPIKFFDFNGSQPVPLPIAPFFRPGPGPRISPRFPANDPVYKPAPPNPPGGSPAPSGGTRPFKEDFPDSPLDDFNPPLEATYDPSSEGLKNTNGDCSTLERLFAQSEVNYACKFTVNARKCRNWDRCVDLKRKYYANKSCCEARRNVNNMCFRGGDKEHRREANKNCEFAKECHSMHFFDCCNGV